MRIKRPDPEQYFRLVITTAAEQVSSKQFGFSHVRAQPAGKAAKQRHGRRIAGADGGVQVAELRAGRPAQDLKQHTRRDAAATTDFGHPDLPDKNRVRLVRGAVSGNESGELAVSFCYDAGTAKMFADQQI